MKKVIRNTEFNNLVNYSTEKSSADYASASQYNSVDPTSLAYVSKNNQIVEYHLVDFSEKEVNNEMKF
ncbi:hypothetical protein [Prolixibacter sp. NT017]|uniref:hypothetical protein n=1 Tax=Prolixibacter sp. NT017 TaxID=2652390 RepID=UPI0012825100|nr:hypothetical protein [Prolixibacter sp. NT017]GET27668.1 hypothetical protein NT017_39970 [Prolixibacter sp. NT017]